MVFWGSIVSCNTVIPFKLLLYTVYVHSIWFPCGSFQRSLLLVLLPHTSSLLACPFTLSHLTFLNRYFLLLLQNTCNSIVNSRLHFNEKKTIYTDILLCQVFLFYRTNLFFTIIYNGNIILMVWKKDFVHKKTKTKTME